MPLNSLNNSMFMFTFAARSAIIIDVYLFAHCQHWQIGCDFSFEVLSTITLSLNITFELLSLKSLIRHTYDLHIIEDVLKKGLVKIGRNRRVRYWCLLMKRKLNIISSSLFHLSMLNLSIDCRFFKIWPRNVVAVVPSKIFVYRAG